MNGVTVSPTKIRRKSDSFPIESPTCKVLILVCWEIAAY